MPTTTCERCGTDDVRCVLTLNAPGAEVEHPTWSFEIVRHCDGAQVVVEKETP